MDINKYKLLVWFILTSPIRVCLHYFVTCRQIITLYEPVFGAKLLGNSERHWQCNCGWKASASAYQYNIT